MAKKNAKTKTVKKTAKKVAAASNIETVQTNSVAETGTRALGRPRFKPAVPVGKFTMQDLMVANGVNLKTGKGPNCSKLTLIKYKDRELAKGDSSFIVRLAEKKAPNSKSGLGRKAEMFQLRAEFMAEQATSVAAPAVESTVTAVEITPEQTTEVAPVADVTETASETPTGDVTVTVAEITTPEPVSETTLSPETLAYEAQKAALLS